jgi:hypothetical protein
MRLFRPLLALAALLMTMVLAVSQAAAPDHGLGNG